MYYEASIKYQKTTDSGKEKKITEKYLCDAVCVSEVELRVSERAKPFISGEFVMKSVKDTKIEEVLNPDHDQFYSLKYGISTIDEKTGADKSVVYEILIGADNFDCAVECFKEYMNGSIADWELLSVAMSPIIEVVK